jgi:hypothetical protein
MSRLVLSEILRTRPGRAPARNFSAVVNLDNYREPANVSNAFRLWILFIRTIKTK